MTSKFMVFTGVTVSFLMLVHETWAGLDTDETIRISQKSHLQKAVHDLSSQSFSFYGLEFSTNEKEALQNTKVSSTQEYNNYGNFEGLNPGVQEFIASLGEGNEENAALISSFVERIVGGILEVSAQESAWVCMRSFTPTNEWALPRWHVDGYYFEPYSGEPYKFAIALKGAATLFHTLPSELREPFETLLKAGTGENNYNRQALADFLGKYPQGNVTAEPLQGAVFIVGSERAAIHSEPPINEERLFLSVLPGTPDQIKQWENR